VRGRWAALGGKKCEVYWLLLSSKTHEKGKLTGNEESGERLERGRDKKETKKFYWAVHKKKKKKKKSITRRKCHV